MTMLKTLAAALAASTLLAGAAVAADHAAQPQPAPSAQQKQVDADAAKLSTDGIAAYRDVHLARLAIYEAKPDQARMFVSHAQSALDKARTDATAFTKAEADLKPPAGMGTAATMAGSDAAKGQGDAGKDAKQPSEGRNAAATQPVKWLPVDAQLVLSDDFVVRDTNQSKAIDEANQHLKGGDQKGAMDRLKLAGINVDFTMAVVPLDKTVQGVDQAAKLIQDGKYYEANTTLKGVEDGVRFDVVDAAAVPKAAGKADSGKADSGKSDATGSMAKPKAQ